MNSTRITIIRSAFLLLLSALAGCEQKKTEKTAAYLSPVQVFEAKLQSAFGQYHPAVLGSQEWQFVELNRSAAPLIIEGKRYDGIKFTYTGPTGSDFVWAFQSPGDDSAEPYFETWFIEPKTGRMSGGFTNKNWRLRKYVQPPRSGALLHIQSVDGERFKTGEDYFIYFAFTHDKPVKLAYRAAIKPLRTDSQGHFLIEAMAQALSIDLTESELVR